jgi:hypothetical protein
LRFNPVVSGSQSRCGAREIWTIDRLGISGRAIQQTPTGPAEVVAYFHGDDLSGKFIRRSGGLSIGDQV